MLQNENAISVQGLKKSYTRLSRISEAVSKALCNPLRLSG